MKAVVLFMTNDCVDYNRTNIREQIDDILDDPNNFKIVDFTDEESMFKMIHTQLNQPKVGVTACNIWENKNTIYAGYYIDIAELIDYTGQGDDAVTRANESEKNIKLNIFGSQISSQKVTSNLVIIKKKLSYSIENKNIKTTSIPDTLSRFEITNILEKVFIKDGIVINVNGETKLYNYIVNPLEHLMLTDPEYEKHYSYHEYEVYTHVLMMIVDKREINNTNNLNHKASLIAGVPVNGTVFIALYRKPDYGENPPYISISIDKFNDILEIRGKSTHFTTGMEVSDREYVNFEKILELEKQRYFDKQTININDIKGNCLNSL